MEAKNSENSHSTELTINGNTTLPEVLDQIEAEGREYNLTREQYHELYFLREKARLIQQAIEDKVDLDHNTNNFIDNTARRHADELLIGLSTTEEVRTHAREFYFDSRHDALTGLPNRRAFEEELEKRKAKRFGILTIDIDNFKSFNDTYGHSTGDAVLIAVANIVKQNTRFRDSEIPTIIRPQIDTDERRRIENQEEGDSVIRQGGEELVVLVAIDNKTELTAVAENIRKAISLINDIEVSAINSDQLQTIKITASIGASMYDPSRQNPLETLRESDNAVYASKGLNKNKVMLYDGVETIGGINRQIYVNPLTNEKYWEETKMTTGKNKPEREYHKISQENEMQNQTIQ